LEVQKIDSDIWNDKNISTTLPDKGDFVNYLDNLAGVHGVLKFLILESISFMFFDLFIFLKAIG
jgi:hypothetical protein